MNKSRKTEFNQFMRQHFGDPRKLPNEQRVYIIRMMGRWLRQNKPDKAYEAEDYSVRHGIERDKLFPLGARSTDRLVDSRWIEAHREAATVSFRMHKNHRVGYWSVFSRTLDLPFTNTLMKHRWEPIRFVHHKALEIIISPTYQLSVAANCVRRDERKIVQKIFDGREYKDKTVWKCFYWDMSALGNDNESWRNATHHEGYVVKHFNHVVVDESLHKAVQAAERKVAADLIKTIQAEESQ